MELTQVRTEKSAYFIGIKFQKKFILELNFMK